MKRKWTISNARYHFSEMIESSVKEPQPIYKRERLVAAVIDAKTFSEFLRWKEQQTGRTIAQAAAELRAICQEEGYEFELPERKDRSNPMLADSQENS